VPRAVPRAMPHVPRVGSVRNLMYQLSNHLSDPATMLMSKNRKPRKDCKFTAEERQAFHAHKEEYRNQSSKQDRFQILQSKILPDIFNYWMDNGARPLQLEEIAKRTKVFWIEIRLIVNAVALGSQLLGGEQLAIT
jgi:hypothetical protein